MDTHNRFECGDGIDIPSFAAGKAHVDSFEFLDGGLGIIAVAGKGLDIDINNGDNWKLPGGIPEFGPAVIDWAASFPELAELSAFDTQKRRIIWSIIEERGSGKGLCGAAKKDYAGQEGRRGRRVGGVEAFWLIEW